MLPESLNEALIEAVKACGGSKVVGPALWGSAAGVENMARKLLACLNPERAEKLSTDEVMQIMSMARARGCHVVMEYFAASLSYSPPQPIEPKDEADELRRQVLEMGKQLQQTLQRIEHLERPALRSAA